MINIDEAGPALSRYRSIFWPIKKGELRIFAPLLIIFFLICFNYSVLKVLKDALVVTASGSGAEVIPFIKMWGVLPAVLLMTFFFTRLANRFKHETIFYMLIGGFLGFFLLFATVLYPLREVIHPDGWVDRLSPHLPSGCRGLLAVVRNWSFSLFYIMAELWGITIMSVLFWGFANEVLSLEKAKRFYILIMIGGNLATTVAGQAVASFSSMNISAEQDAWGYTISTLSLLIVCVGMGALAAFRWFEKLLQKGDLFSREEAKPRLKDSDSASLRGNLSYLFRFRPLIFLAVIVVSYNICINLTEVAWKDQVKMLYPHPNDFNAYMGKVLSWTGLLATLFGFCVNAFIQKIRWKALALLTPLITLITGCFFFVFSFINEAETFFGAAPLLISVFFGSAQVCFSKASKFSLFDMTKELAFISLNNETKFKGKAVVDGLGSRIGKSGGSFLYQSLILSVGSIASSIPYVAAVFFAVVIAWLYAVYALGKCLKEGFPAEVGSPLKS